MTFAELWQELAPIGRAAGTGGYRRYSWTPADAECRAWFTRRAEALGLTVEPDCNGNLWAWWGPRGAGAVVTGIALALSATAIALQMLEERGDLQTPYGPLRYSLKTEGGRVVWHLAAGTRVPPGGLVLVWPGRQPPPRDTRINGRAAQWDGPELRVRQVPATVVVNGQP